jgi:hypothetical protein
MDFEGIGRVAPTPRSRPAPRACRRCSTHSEDEDWDVSFTVNGFLAGSGRDHLPLLLGVADGAISLGAIAA